MSVPNGSRLSTKSNLPYDKTAEEDVQIWRVMEGKITEMLLTGDVFVLRDDVPSELDPALVARQFLNVFDIGKTRMMRRAYSDSKGVQKAKVTSKGTESKPPRKYQKPMNYERVDFINNVAVYKEPIIGFYRRFSGRFTRDEFDEYLAELFPKVTKVTILNKRRAYLQYMEKEGFIKRTPIMQNVPRMGFTYEFLKAPFDAEPAAQAEFDQSYARKSMVLELATMRQGV